MFPLLFDEKYEIPVQKQYKQTIYIYSNLKKLSHQISIKKNFYFTNYFGENKRCLKQKLNCNLPTYHCPLLLLVQFEIITIMHFKGLTMCLNSFDSIKQD